jgi:hypothetical protein
LESSKIDLDKTIPVANTKDLCDYVAMYRVLKIGKDIAIKCMVELDNRKNIDNTIDYQLMINDSVEKLKLELKGDSDYGTFGAEISTFWKKFGGS